MSGKAASFWAEIRSSVVLGAREMTEQLARKHRPRGDFREVPDFVTSARPQIEWESELVRVAKAFAIPPDHLKTRRRNFPARQALFYHLVQNCGIRPARVAEWLGVRQTAVSLGISRFRSRKVETRPEAKTKDGNLKCSATI